MRGAFKMAIMALFIILTFSAAQAQFMAGYELVQAWEAYNRVDEGKGRDGDLGLGYLYMGYVTGVWDAIGYLLEPPSTINVGQVCSVVGKYLDAHPERRLEPAFALVLSALLEAFPKRGKTT